MDMGKEKKMPRGDRHKTKALGVRLDPSLVDQFRQLAKTNRRTLTAEMSIAMEHHLRLGAVDRPKDGSK